MKNELSTTIKCSLVEHTSNLLLVLNFAIWYFQSFLSMFLSQPSNPISQLVFLDFYITFRILSVVINLSIYIRWLDCIWINIYCFLFVALVKYLFFILIIIIFTAALTLCTILTLLMKFFNSFIWLSFQIIMLVVLL